MLSTSGQARRAHAPLGARILHWVRGPTFGRDIALVLAFKLVLLMALKYAFFNHPQAENMAMRPADVAQAILSVPAPATRATQTTSTPTNVEQGDHHAH
ncbi:cytochrome oxidase putative small subunit CydP [Paraburkholderia bannensis]|uniref:cytochrome oxidase putative small subunit CydP n=1 Tax=Paraburkholderia bannensis TaxID=765414 RepID=UPI0007C53B7A|nr:cytochrome oxidase putative small subunit CydP [Paraburkholderia bannensis]